MQKCGILKNCTFNNKANTSNQVTAYFNKRIKLSMVNVSTLATNTSMPDWQPKHHAFCMCADA